MIIDGNYNLFTDLTIESLNLEKDVDYKVSEGSTIIEFTKSGISKLNSLKKTYQVSVNYSNGKKVTSNLIIEEKIVNPQTSDNITLYISILIISLVLLFKSKYNYKKIFNN